MKTKKIKASELIEDFGLYPRTAVDATHVNNLFNALNAGAKFPPIIIDQKNRIVDGFHRKRAMVKADGDDAMIPCDIREYATDKDAYLDALRYNSKHGKFISGSEQTAAILKARAFKIKPDIIASALGITQARVEGILQSKVTTVRPYKPGKSTYQIPTKRSVRHLAKEDTITESQAKAIKMAPGQPLSLLLRQLNELIENDLVDWEDERNQREFQRLLGNIEKIQNMVSQFLIAVE